MRTHFASMLVRTASAALCVGLSALHSTAQAAPSCPEPVTARAFYQQVSAGDMAYVAMDLDAFHQARMKARQMVPCLSEAITPAQAAGYHRLEALGAFLGRDHAGAVAALKALVGAAPGYQLSTELAPDGHPLRLYFSIAEGTPAAPTRTMAPLPEGWVAIDGATTTEWPVDRPYLLQSFDSGGQVESTALRSVGQPPVEEPKNRGMRVTAKTRTARTLSLVSGGAAVVAGGLYLGARASSKQFWDPSTPSAELAGLRSRTNTLGWASAGVGVVAVGTGGAAILVGTW